MKNGKKILYLLIKLLVTALVFWWIDRSFGFEKIVEELQQIDGGWFLGAVLVHVISIFIGAWQWHIILSNRGVKISLFQAIKLYYTGMFFNHFVLGSIAGDSVKIATLHTQENHAKAGFAATFLDRFAGLVALCVYALIGSSIIALINFEKSKELYSSFLLLGFFSLILIIVSAVLFSKRAQNILFVFLKKLPSNILYEKIYAIILVVLIDRKKMTDRHMTLQVIALSVVIQGLRISTHMFCAAALGIFMWNTVHYYFVIIPITALIMMIPLPFGVIPALAGGLFAAAGFAHSEATVMEFLAAIVGIISSLAGIFFFFTNKKSTSPKNNEEI